MIEQNAINEKWVKPFTIFKICFNFFIRILVGSSKEKLEGSRCEKLLR